MPLGPPPTSPVNADRLGRCSIVWMRSNWTLLRRNAIWIAVGAALPARRACASRSTSEASARRGSLPKFFIKQIASLTVTRTRCSTFRSWPGTSLTRAPRGSGSGTGLSLRAWRVFRFRRTAVSRISRVPRWRPHGSLTSSRGRAPQPSRSIRIHRNARCEPRRCAVASPSSYRRPDCAAASRSSIRAVFRPTGSKRPQACRAATAGQRR